MAVSGINPAANLVVKSGASPAPKQNSPAAPTPAPAGASSSTPAATVQLSQHAIVAAASTSTPATTSGTTGSVPKVNAVKVANKEANEPLQLLTKQAKHGDPIAKLLLKQITAKQAAKQAESAETEGASETEESSPKEETHGAESSAKSEGSESSQGSESAGPAEAGKGELVDQHA
jgi:hypothetical protein